MIDNLLKLPAAKWKRLTIIKARVDKLHREMADLLQDAVPTGLGRLIKKRRKMSASAKKKIAAAAKARWAKVRATKGK